MTEKSFNMDCFSHSIYLDCGIEKAYEFIGRTDGFNKWFIGSAEYISGEGIQRKTGEFIRVNDSYKWKWLAKDFSTSGKILESKENSLLKFSFGGLFLVIITINEDKGRTLLTLKQKYVNGVAHNDFAHINCCVCWAFFLTNLKSVIEHGTDLRETETDNEELVNR